MRYTTFINNQKCIEWGLNAHQGALFDLLNQLASWANETIIDGKVYYHISRNKVIDELPLFYSKSDTVYRHFKTLDDKGLIEFIKHGVKDLIRLTPLGKEWNSEINPSKLGNKSESDSEINPTYNNTSSYNNTRDNKGAEKTIFLPPCISSDVWNEWVQHRKELKKSLTPTTIKKQLAQLEKWDKLGMDTSEIIHTSITNGWLGLFPLRNGARQSNGNGTKNAQTTAEAYEAMKQEQNAHNGFIDTEAYNG